MQNTYCATKSIYLYVGFWRHCSTTRSPITMPDFGDLICCSTARKQKRMEIKRKNEMKKASWSCRVVVCFVLASIVTENISTNGESDVARSGCSWQPQWVQGNDTKAACYYNSLRGMCAAATGHRNNISFFLHRHVNTTGPRWIRRYCEFNDMWVL